MIVSSGFRGRTGMEQDPDAMAGEGAAEGGPGGPGGPGGAGEEGAGPLLFEDEGLVPSAMRALNMMRKNRHFCDVVLHTGCAEVPAHRAVLAAASPYLFELFTTDQDRSGGSTAVVLPLSYKLSGPCERRALLSLVDYAYTGQLTVPAHQVRSVYLCAWQLRMDAVVARCGRFLAGSWLTRDTCLGVRALPGLAPPARTSVDRYIADNFSSLYKSSTLSALPLVQVEVLYALRKDMDAVEHTALADLLLHWLRDQIIEEQAEVSSLCGRTHLLYMAAGRGLRDCAALPPATSDTPLLQDYRRMLLKCPPNKGGKRNGNGHPPGVASNGALYSRDIVERAHRQPGDDWAVIVSERLAEHTFLSLMTLDGHLALVSAALRLHESPLPSPGAPLLPPAVPRGTAQVLAPLTRARAAHGMAVLDGRIIVCGGYDRVECLNSVESYDPFLNKWTQLPDMRQQRGRFNIAQVGDCIYAVGGSDGHVELDSVEMYRAVEGGSMTASMTTSLEGLQLEEALQAPLVPNGNASHQRKKAWTKRARLPLARSYAGVCGGEDGRVFCVGGWAGQPGVRDCHVLDSEADKWEEMAPLNTGRYQAGVCVWEGGLWAVGGCDAWHCLATTEVLQDLQPGDNTPSAWHFGPSLSVARRGCGVAAWGGRLAAAGGSDGQHSLRSVELLSPGGQWEPGPALREPRAGLTLAALNDRLIAVGGYSGKVFLSSMEYLVKGTDEWTTFTMPFPSQLCLVNSRGPSPVKLEEVLFADSDRDLKLQELKLNGDIRENGTHSQDSKNINGEHSTDEDLTTCAVKENGEVKENGDVEKGQDAVVVCE